MTIMIFTKDGEAHYFYDPDEVLIEEPKGVNFEGYNDGYMQVFKYKKEEE